jgi:hypothetical protein
VPSPSLTVTPATAQLTSGGAPVVFSAALTNGTEAIHWTLDGPGSLSSASGANTTYTPPAALPEDTQATLLATSGAVSARATLTLTRASGILVAGRVVDFRGTPATNVTIAIGSQTTLTDGSGHFAVGNVSTPYTLTASSSEQHLAVVYQGLTRSDPTILWRLPISTPEREGRVEGRILGAPPSTGDVQTTLTWASPEAVILGHTAGSDYSLPLGWVGPASTTGSLHVLQSSGFQRGLPTSFPAYGVRSGVTVGEATTASGIDVTLTPPTVSFVHGTYSLPGDHAFLLRALALNFNDGGFLLLGFDDDLGLEFTYPVPGGIDASAAILVEAGRAGASVTRQETGIPLGATNVQLELPQAAASLSPADGATGVDAQTDFSWERLPGGVYVVTFSTAPPAPTVYLVTQDTHAAIPQVREALLPGGTRYQWNVMAQAPLGSVDAAAGAAPFREPGNTLISSFSDPRFFETR